MKPLLDTSSHLCICHLRYVRVPCPRRPEAERRRYRRGEFGHSYILRICLLSNLIYISSTQFLPLESQQVVQHEQLTPMIPSTLRQSADMAIASKPAVALSTEQNACGIDPWKLLLSTCNEDSPGNVASARGTVPLSWFPATANRANDLVVVRESSSFPVRRLLDKLISTQDGQPNAGGIVPVSSLDPR